MKQELKKRFDVIYRKKRLLAIQLNGFSHKVFYDNGKNNTPIVIEEYSHYVWDTKTQERGTEEAKFLFAGIYHNQYQHNAKEYVWVLPKERV